MTLHDLYLLSPEVSLAGVGLVVILLDMVITNKSRLAWISCVGLLIPLIFSLTLWGDLTADTGGQMIGVFDTLVVDKFAIFFKILILGVVGVVVISSADYMSKLKNLEGEYYGLMLFSASGMMLLAATTDLISIYIAMELTALPLAALAAFLGNARATESGMKFLLLSAMSSAILLYGMTLTYGFTGTTQLSEILQQLGSSVNGNIPFGSHAMFLGVIMIVAGFGFKIAAVPFQMWVPDVYEGSPTPITAYLSVASKAAGFAVILRVFYLTFPQMGLDWSSLFAVLSAVSMTIGNLVAIAQTNIKRMLAYSTVAHAGFLMMGVAAIGSVAISGGSSTGPSSVLFYLVAYAITNLSAFFVVIAVSNHTNSEEISSFTGLGKRSPILAVIMAFALISLLGLPPAVGFMGKLYIFSAAVNSGLIWLVVLGVVNSAISAYYYLRIIRFIYMVDTETEERIHVSFIPMVTVCATGLAMLIFGIFPDSIILLAEKATAILLM